MITPVGSCDLGAVDCQIISQQTCASCSRTVPTLPEAAGVMSMAQVYIATIAALTAGGTFRDAGGDLFSYRNANFQVRILMLRLAPLILRNVLRNRRRTLLTLASTAISLALLALLFAIYQSFFHGDDTSPSSALRIVCRHKVSLTQSLPASYQTRIKEVEGIEQVSAWTWFGGQYIKPENFFGRFAVDSDCIFDIFKDWTVSAEQLAAFKQMRSGCAVGEKIAQKYGIKLGDKVQIVGDIYPVTLDLTCVAIYGHPPNEENLVFHREYLSELLKAAGICAAGYGGDIHSAGTFARMRFLGSPRRSMQCSRIRRIRRGRNRRRNSGGHFCVSWETSGCFWRRSVRRSRSRFCWCRRIRSRWPCASGRAKWRFCGRWALTRGRFCSWWSGSRCCLGAVGGVLGIGLGIFAVQRR